MDNTGEFYIKLVKQTLFRMSTEKAMVLEDILAGNWLRKCGAPLRL